jgi:ferredoxin
MALRIDGELCTGCGACVEACAYKAIQLIDQRAAIDLSKCTQCEACLDACPNGAIVDELVRSSAVLITPPAAIEPETTSVHRAITAQETKGATHGIKAVAGAALAFLSSEVAPRLIDVVIRSMERRLAQPATTTIPPSPSAASNFDLPGKGLRKQTRYRGGNKANRKSKGRR